MELMNYPELTTFFVIERLEMVRSRPKSSFLLPLYLLVFVLPLLALTGAAQDVWTGVERVIAVGDVHGDYEQLVGVLQSAGVIDQEGKWIGGKTHLVQTGDMLDRGPDSRKVMDLLIRLQEEASKTGGRVHVLIGNHEAMNIYGDLRYVSVGQLRAVFTDGNSEKEIRRTLPETPKTLERIPPPEGVPKFDEAYRNEAGNLSIR